VGLVGCIVVTAIEIHPTPFDAPVAQVMAAAALDELAQRYGGAGDGNPIESDEFDPPAGVFLVAYRDGEPVGCGGWRTISHHASPAATAEEVAEIKRLYVSSVARNGGVATAILRALEAAARACGIRRIVLETGGAQPEAIALYIKMGYEKIPNYGYYKDEPDTVSFGRDLQV
jgi:GNAT superfamily N-acetyltransferase